jgi:hypothetical protein
MYNAASLCMTYRVWYVELIMLQSKCVHSEYTYSCCCHCCYPHTTTANATVICVSINTQHCYRLEAERQDRAGTEALIIAKLREALIEEGRRRRYRYSEELSAARCELKRVRAVSSSSCKYCTAVALSVFVTLSSSCTYVAAHTQEVAHSRSCCSGWYMS